MQVTPVDNNRYLWGTWELVFNLDTLSVAAVPSRLPQNHYEVTDLVFPPACDDCVTVDIMEFKPVEKKVSIRVGLVNKTGQTAFDVRGAIVHYQKALNLRNADSYISEFFTGYEIPPWPFKAFAVDQPNREFLPGTGHARIYDIAYAEIADLEPALLRVDASWPGNWKGPYEISNAHTSEEVLDLQPVDISCEVHSWQDDVSCVEIDLTCLGIYTSYYFDNYIPMSHLGGDTWIVEGVSWKPGGKGSGTHRAMIRARTESSTYMYNYVNVTIAASDPVDGWGRGWATNIPQLDTNDMDVDSSGCAYVCGSFYDLVDFDPGTGINYVISSGESDAFLCKYSGSGDLLWVKTWGGEDADDARAVSVDGMGNIYVCGMAEGTADLNPGAGFDWQSGNGTYLIKLDSSGDFLWANRWGDALTHCFGLAADSGGVVVCGDFKGSIDFDPGLGENGKTSCKYYDWEWMYYYYCEEAYVSKFNPDGEHEWASIFGDWPEGEGQNYLYGRANDMAFASDGCLFITGRYKGTTTFGTFSEDNVHYSYGEEACVVKYNPDGSTAWGLPIHGGGEGTGVATASDGSIYFTGYFSSQIDLDPGEGEDIHIAPGSIYDSETYLCKLAGDSTYLWGLTWAGDNDEFGRDVAVDSAGNVIVTGALKGIGDYDPGAGENLLDPLPIQYVQQFSGYLSKFSSTGDYIFTTLHNIDTYSIATHGEYIYILGMLYKSADLDPGPGLKNFTPDDWGCALVKCNPVGWWN